MRKLRKIAAIDGFRGIGVSIVVIGHLPMIQGAMVYNAVWDLIQVSRIGYICLDIFFAVSGFFITRLLLAEKQATGHISFRRFYERRALRIFPVYFLTLFVCFVVFPMNAPAIASLLTYTFNIYHPLVGTPNPMEHTWSLSVEEQFYFAWPFLIACLPMRWLPMLTLRILPGIAVASGLAISWLVVSDDRMLSGNLVYMLPLTRMLSLSLGGWLAVREFENRPFFGRSCVALIVLAIGLLVIDLELKRTGVIVSQGLYWTLALIAYGLISLAVSATLIFDEGGFASGIRQFLDFKPLRDLGQLSYAFYVFHLPVLFYFRINDAALPGRIAPATTVIAVAAISLGLAILSHKLIEGPLMALRSDRRPTQASAVSQ